MNLLGITAAKLFDGHSSPKGQQQEFPYWQIVFPTPPITACAQTG